MFSIANFPSPVFSKLAARSGTKEHFAQNVERYIQTVQKDKEFVAQQIKQTTVGPHASIVTLNYPNIMNGSVVPNYEPFLPNSVPQPAPVLDISDGESALTQEPYTTGGNLDVSV